MTAVDILILEVEGSTLSINPQPIIARASTFIAAMQFLESGGSGGIASVTGTANQIDATTVAGAVTLALDPALILPGSFTVQNGQNFSFGGNTTALITGTGPLVFGNNPIFVAPQLGTPASGNLVNCTGVGVTSVGLAAPGQFTVSGSPVTGAGSLAFAWANQNANLVLAGPSSGAAAAPTFRNLTAADLPTNSPINYVVGNWYIGANGAEASGTANGANTIRWCPIYISQPMTISNLGINIGTVSAGGNCQLAIYASSATTGLPTGNALVSTANISTAATGFLPGAAALSFTAPGVYWFGVNADNATVAFSGFATTSTTIAYSQGSSTFAFLSSGGPLLTTAQAFGTWPNNPAVVQAAGGTVKTPLPFFEVASVP